MQFIADQTIPEASVEEIRTLGNLVDVVEATSGADRRDLLGRAASQDRVVLSFDYDYHELVFADGQAVPPGIVCFQFDGETPRDPADVLVAVLTDGNLELQGTFTILENDKMRQKPLPEN